MIKNNFLSRRPILFVLLGFFLLMSAPIQAKQHERGRNFGLGILLGEPSRITGKYWLTATTAVEFGLAYSFANYFVVLADHLWHFPDLIRSDEKFLRQLTPYLGVGGVLFVGGDSAKLDRRGFTDGGRHSVGAGARVPVGIEWEPKDPPIGVYLELAPGIGIIPAVYPFFQGGLGIRYYF